jgi:hypothetical protein
VRAPTTGQRDVFRSRIILLAAEGRSTRSIARAANTMPLENSAAGFLAELQDALKIGHLNPTFNIVSFSNGLF